jgi:hypothetical protein
MQSMRRHIPLAGALALAALVGTAGLAGAQELEKEFAAKPRNGLTPDTKIAHPPGGSRCAGKIQQVFDVGFEGLKTTMANYAAPAGGGEGGRFDPLPVLSAGVTLTQGTCLNAHFSAIVGSAQTYGGAPLTLFQVTATPVGSLAPQHLYGHYETPYGVYAPAVATEAERDVDEHASNFFARVGTGPGDLPPGNYRIDVWWAGAGGPGGALAMAFVLKLYLY